MRFPTNLTRSRNLLIGGGFAAILLALAAGEAFFDNTAAAQSQGAVMAPRFEVDPLWPKPLPNHWVLGSTIGVWVDTDDHVWIIHRSSATACQQRKAAGNRAGRMLCGRAAGARIRSGGQSAAPLGRDRAKAMNGRIPTTAFSSTTKAMSGSAAMAGPTRDSEIHQGR